MDRLDWNQRYAGRDFVWTVEPNRFVKAEAASLAPRRVLDLACGEGRNSVWLAEQGWTVTGVDFSDTGIEKARRLAEARGVAARVACEVADVTAYRPEKGAFELVVICYLQIPAAELALVIAGAAKALAPGGTVLIVGHDAANLDRGYGGPKSLEVLYRTERIVAALGEEILIEKAGTVERPVETEEGPRVALDCLVRGRRR